MKNHDAEQINALNEMFAASKDYRKSGKYLDMMRFISKLPKYSPYNGMLLFHQNPGISYVATPLTWARRFRRYPKHDARPLLILMPMGPVGFVYDLKDTEGRAVPVELIRPFLTKGKLSKFIYDYTIYNCRLHGIMVIETLLAHENAGSVCQTGILKRYRDIELPLGTQYVILINKEYTLEDKYSSLAHELGHIFCGHVGNNEDAWWPCRTGNQKDIIEIEAESVAYLVCLRNGLDVNSERYLSVYRANLDKQMPVFSLSDILQAVGYIEEMGRGQWKKPKKKSRYKKDKPKA